MPTYRFIPTLKHTHIHTHLHTYTPTHTHRDTHTHTHIHRYSLTHLYLPTQTHTHLCTYTPTHTHKDTHTHTYIHRHSLTYLHLLTHTDTRTHFDNLNPPLFLPLYTWDLYPMKLSRIRVSFHTLKLPSKVLDINIIQICLGSGGKRPAYTLLVWMQIGLTFWRPPDNIHRNFQVHNNLLSEIYLIYMFHQPPKVQTQEYLLLHHLRENVIGAGVCIKQHQPFSRNDEYLFV